MTKHYQNYAWKDGIPYGVHEIDPSSEVSYKIVMDPYWKRISIEKYLKGYFEGIIYDSILLDFRHLKPSEQMAWQRTVVSETTEMTSCLIRNQDDRVLFIEEYYKNNECHVKSAQGILLSIHKIYYEANGDPFNGVILYDINEHPVMFKKYDIDPLVGDFGELLEECWHLADKK